MGRNQPKGRSAKESNPKQGGSNENNQNLRETSMENEPQLGGSSNENHRRLEEILMENVPQPGRSSNEPRAGETSNEKSRRPSMKCETCGAPVTSVATEVKFRTCEECEGRQRPARGSPTSEEDEKSFLNLFFSSSLRGRLGSWLSKVSSSPRHSPPPKEGNIHLQREMRLISAINFVVLVSLGTGIYEDPSTILEWTGSVTEALMVWLICGALTLLVAITYGELVFVVSQSGARFGYLLTAFSPFHKFFGPLPAFITTWIGGLILGPARVSLTCLILAEHFYLPTDYVMKTYHFVKVTDPIYVKQVIGTMFVCLITLINSRSLRFCVFVQLVFGVVALLACTVVIGGGLYFSISQGNSTGLDSLFKDMKGNSSGIFKSIFIGMWSYDGWNNLVVISEEMIDPLWTIPRAVMIGLPIATFLYISMHMATLSVLTPEEMKIYSHKHLFLFEERLFGTKRMITPMFSAITAIGSAMCVQLGVSRTLFAAGREGHMLEMHTYLNVRRFVPIPALITQAILSLIFIFVIPFLDLIEYLTMITWAFYGLDLMALIILRVKLPDVTRLYKTPLAIPIVLTTLSVLVSMFPVLRWLGNTFRMEVTITLIAVIVYYIFIYKEKRIFRMDRFNQFVRTALNVAPPTALPEGYTHATRVGTTRRHETIAQTLHSTVRYYK